MENGLLNTWLGLVLGEPSEQISDKLTGPPSLAGSDHGRMQNADSDSGSPAQECAEIAGAVQ